MDILNYQTVLVPASESNEKLTTSRMNSNSEKRGNIDLTEASTSEIKMTIHLPGTTSTNTKMGVSFDTCLYTSIKIHVFRAREIRAMLKMHCSPFLNVS